jgi:hypothetical protein
MSLELTIASQRAAGARVIRDCDSLQMRQGNQCPSGVRTPNQLSRTC